MSLEERDLDMESWIADWQAAEPGSETRSESGAEPSIDSIRRGFRRYRWTAVGSWLVGLTMAVATTALAWLDRTPSLVVAALAVWTLVAVTAILDVHYRRGTWRLAGESTLDYIELARRQLVARLRGIRFGWGLLGAETLFFLFWLPWVASADPATRGELLVRGFGLLALFVLLFSIGLAVMRRRAERELRALELARGELKDLELAA